MGIVVAPGGLIELQYLCNFTVGTELIEGSIL